MNGILLLTHKDIAQALVACVEHVYGACPNFVECCTVQGGDAEAKAHVASHLEAMKQRYSHILILTDLYGASPSNIATQHIQPDVIAALSGVNAPMLLRAISYHNEPFSSFCQKAIEGGTRGIIMASLPPSSSL
jgi:PTS system mannose-specific IIA component